jgi:hypothetical protein
MRARNIKPGFFLNEDLSEVDYATRLLFIGLWCFADCCGRFEWKPKKIHAAIFPYDHELDIEKMLCNLMSLHLITCQDKVGYVPCFLKHQNPHPHEAKSVLPVYKEQIQEDSECNKMSLHLMKCQADVLNPDVLNPDVLNPTTSCSEPEKTPASDLKEEIIFKIPLIDKTYIGITQSDVNKWQDVFPAVNIIPELKRIALWCEDNPTKKKTRRGANRFISAWLERKQNQGGAIRSLGFKNNGYSQGMPARTVNNINAAMEFINEGTK